jgi:hypothetical protein
MCPNHLGDNKCCCRSSATLRQGLGALRTKMERYSAQLEAADLGRAAHILVDEDSGEFGDAENLRISVLHMLVTRQPPTCSAMARSSTISLFNLRLCGTFGCQDHIQCLPRSARDLRAARQRCLHGGNRHHRRLSTSSASLSAPWFGGHDGFFARGSPQSDTPRQAGVWCGGSQHLRESHAIWAA